MIRRVPSAGSIPPTARRSPAALRSENVDPSVSSGSLNVALISSGVPSTVAPSAGVASMSSACAVAVPGKSRTSVATAARAYARLWEVREGILGVYGTPEGCAAAFRGREVRPGRRVDAPRVRSVVWETTTVPGPAADDRSPAAQSDPTRYDRPHSPRPSRRPTATTPP